MDPDAIIRLIVLVVLIVLSGFFSSAETALTTVNTNKLKALAEEGKKKAAKVLKMRENSAKLLSTILVGNNIVNLSASALSTTLFTELFGSKAVGIVTGVLTFLILIFGEITPKTIANAHSLGLSMAYAYPISFLMIIFTPIIWILNIICRGIFRILGLDPDKDNDKITEKELRVIVSSSEEAGVIEQSEKKMITNVVDFGDAIAKDVMIPRADMISVDVEDSYDEIFSVIKEEGYTRIPVYRKSRDHIIGILHVKDIFLCLEKNEGKKPDISKLLRKPVFVYEYQKTSGIFADMKRSGTSICIVLDEYGITSGLITMEDLIEEIVGEIRDEYDESENEIIRKLDDDTYDVEGSIRLDDLNDAIGTTISSDNYDTLGGYIIELLDRLPDEGDEVSDGTVNLKVLSASHNRVDRVKIEIIRNEGEESEAQSEKESDE
ncbi:MAG: hemolysin family protein [Eubacterium sp.]|nr:hemolysin family protein [Eubacterium sp.]